MGLKAALTILVLVLGLVTAPRIGYLVLSPLVDPPSAERKAFLDRLRELPGIDATEILISRSSPLLFPLRAPHHLCVGP